MLFSIAGVNGLMPPKKSYTVSATGNAKEAEEEDLLLHLPTSVEPSEVRSYELEQVLRGHTKAVYQCDFEPTLGHWLATCSHDMSAVIWDIRNGKIVRTLKEHAGWVMFVRWTIDGNFLVTASADKTIKVWGVHKTYIWQDFECLHTMTGHDGIITGLAVSPDTSVLLSCGKDKLIKVWDLKRATQTLLRKEGDASLMYTLKGAPENYDGHAHDIQRIEFSPTGKEFISASADASIKRWNTETGELMLTYTGHTESVMAVCFRFDYVFFASASHDKTIKIWDTENGRCAVTLKGHTDIVYDVKFSGAVNQGRYLISCGHDSKIFEWDAKKSFDLVHYVGTHVGWILSIGLSPDNFRLASTGGDHRVNVWLAKTRSCGECCHECCFDCNQACGFIC